MCVLCICVCKSCWRQILVGTLIVMRNPECTEPFFLRLLGNASLFTKILFTFVPIKPPPPPNQQNYGFRLEFLLKGPQTELRTLSQNRKQTLQKLPGRIKNTMTY